LYRRGNGGAKESVALPDWGDAERVGGEPVCVVDLLLLLLVMLIVMFGVILCPKTACTADPEYSE
jgi:hypothetical protein